MIHTVTSCGECEFNTSPVHSLGPCSHLITHDVMLRVLFVLARAAAVEQRLGNVREARWIYHRAARVSPNNADLWKDVTSL